MHDILIHVPSKPSATPVAKLVCIRPRLCLKEAGNSFSGLGVDLLKLKFRKEAMECFDFLPTLYHLFNQWSNHTLAIAVTIATVTQGPPFEMTSIISGFFFLRPSPPLLQKLSLKIPFYGGARAALQKISKPLPWVQTTNLVNTGLKTPNGLDEMLKKVFIINLRDTNAHQHYPLLFCVEAVDSKSGDLFVRYKLPIFSYLQLVNH